MLFFGFGLLFWLYWLPIFAIMLWLVEDEHFVFSGLLSLLAITGAWFLFNVSLVAFAIANPLLFLGYVAAYLIFGSMWSTFWKWPRFCKWYVSKNLNTIRREIKSKMEDKGEDFDPKALYASSLFDLSPLRHTKRLMNWTIYWPISFSWMLLSKPVQFLWDMIYAALSGFYVLTVHKAIMKSVDFDELKIEADAAIARADIRKSNKRRIPLGYDNI
jgi:hypothetical protein